MKKLGNHLTCLTDGERTARVARRWLMRVVSSCLLFWPATATFGDANSQWPQVDVTAMDRLSASLTAGRSVWLEPASLGPRVEWIAAEALPAASFPTASQEDARSFVLQLYRLYYQRTPNAAELQTWLTGIQRGDTLLDVHASFLGSDELFDKCGRSTEVWVERMFAANLNRLPSPSERQHWINRLTATRNDRRKVGREFLRANQHGNVNPPPVTPPNNGQPLGDLPRQMVTNAQLLSQSIRAEAGGLSAALWQLQANNLLNQSQQAQNAYADVNRNPQAARAAHSRVETAIQALADSLTNQFGVNTSLYYLNQVNQIHQDIGRRLPATSGPISGPIIPPNRPNPGFGLSDAQSRDLSRATNQALARFQNFELLLQDLSFQDYRYRVLVSTCQSVNSDLQTLSNRVRPGASINQLLTDIRVADGRVQALGNRLQSTAVDFRVTQNWYECRRAFDAVKQQVDAIGGNFPSPVTPNPPPSAALLRWIEQSIDQCDLLIQQYSRLFFSGTGYSRFVAQLRNLKNSLVILRMRVLENANRNAIREAWQSVRDNYNFVLNEFPNLPPNPRSNQTPDISSLTSPMEQLDRQLQDWDR